MTGKLHKDTDALYQVYLRWKENPKAREGKPISLGTGYHNARIWAWFGKPWFHDIAERHGVKPAISAAITISESLLTGKALMRDEITEALVEPLDIDFLRRVVQR